MNYLGVTTYVPIPEAAISQQSDGSAFTVYGKAFSPYTNEPVWIYRGFVSRDDLAKALAKAPR